MKKLRVICLIAVIIMLTLTTGGLAQSRWYVLSDMPQRQILLDTFSFDSACEDKEGYRIYKAKGWLKFESNTSEDKFKTILESLEVICKTNKKMVGGVIEYRILERYSYDWDGNEVYHKKYESPEWETPAPGGGREDIIMRIVDYDYKKKKE